MTNETQYKNIEAFINHLKTLQDKNIQINAVMQYFIDNVQYDYTTHEIIKSENQLDNFERIDNAYDCGNPEQREKALQELKKFGYSNEYISRISREYGKQFTIPATQERMVFGTLQPARPEQTKIRSLYMARALVRPEVKEENGMITKGVCANYTAFINKVCRSLEIPIEAVNGETVGGHVWNKIEGKHYDITYAIYIRDGYKYNGWNQNVKKEDWLGIDDKKLFDLQPIRRIQKIDGKDVSINTNIEDGKSL